MSDSACTSEERQRFAAWLRRSNLHVEEFLRLSILAQRLGEPSAWSNATAEQLVAEALNGEATVTQLKDARPAVTHAVTRNRSRWLLPLAAACAAAAALLLAFNRDWLQQPIGTYITEVGEQRSLTLEDGSVVELNTQSELRTHFTADARTV